MIKEDIARLRKLQHLVLIREEHLKVGDGDKASELEATANALLSEMSPEAVGAYKRMSAKSNIFVSPLSKGNCSACGMKVPTSIMQHVIAADRLTPCMNCGRILYCPEVKSNGLRSGQPDPKFLLSRFSNGKLMVPELKATTQEAAIAELCAVLAKEKIITDTDAVVAAALAREKILTTAVGHGLAFPHMRGVEEGVLTFAAGVSHAGIDWDGQLVHLVFFTVLPVAASPFYLKLLAAIAQTFEDDEKLPFVLASADAKTLWKELNKATRTAVKNLN